MKFVLIFGPQAVGKMTVGHELEKITDLKLFHNHMTIELLAPYFGFSREMWGLVNKFRQDVFETAAKSDIYGMIFTYVWGFDFRAIGTTSIKFAKYLRTRARKSILLSLKPILRRE